MVAKLILVKIRCSCFEPAGGPWFIAAANPGILCERSVLMPPKIAGNTAWGLCDDAQ